MPPYGPPSDLPVVLKTTKRQFFHLHYISGKTLEEATEIFDWIFEEVSKKTRLKICVTLEQWQACKLAWDHEWRLDDGSSGPTQAMLKELDKLPLWYDGTSDVLEDSLQTVSIRPQITMNLFHGQQAARSHDEDGPRERYSMFASLSQPQHRSEHVSPPPTEMSTPTDSPHCPEPIVSHDHFIETKHRGRPHQEAPITLDNSRRSLAHTSEHKMEEQLQCPERLVVSKLTLQSEPHLSPPNTTNHPSRSQDKSASKVSSNAQWCDRVYRTSTRKKTQTLFYGQSPQ